MPIKIITCFLLLLSATSSHATETNSVTTKEAYELQEKCGRRAEEWFKQNWGDGIVNNDKKLVMMADYRNHYSKKMNRCFLLLTINTTAQSDKSSSSSISISVFDLNDHSDIGVYEESSVGGIKKCVVHNQKCGLRDEWNSLVAAYMED